MPWGEREMHVGILGTLQGILQMPGVILQMPWREQEMPYGIVKSHWGKREMFQGILEMPKCNLQMIQGKPEMPHGILQMPPLPTPPLSMVLFLAGHDNWSAEI